MTNVEETSEKNKASSGLTNLSQMFTTVAETDLKYLGLPLSIYIKEILRALCGRTIKGAGI